MPAVRRRHHVLAARRDRARGRRHRRRRHARRGARKIATPLEGAAPAAEIRDRLALGDRALDRRASRSPSLLGRPQVPRGAARERPVVAVHRGRPQRRGDVPRPARAPARYHAPQSAVLVIATGRLASPRSGRSGRASGRYRDRHAGRSTRRQTPSALVEVLLGGARRRRHQGARRRVIRGQPAVRVAARLDARRQGPRPPPRRPLDRLGRPRPAAVPPTIQALLAARLDDLSREERAIMEPASVIGLAFPRAGDRGLVPDSLRPGVPATSGAEPQAVPWTATPPTRARRDLPLPEPHDQGRRLRLAAQAGAGHAARAVRRLGGAGQRRARPRAPSSRRSTATTSSRPTATGPSSGRSTPRAARSRSAPRRSSRTPAGGR